MSKYGTYCYISDSNKYHRRKWNRYPLRRTNLAAELELGKLTYAAHNSTRTTAGYLCHNTGSNRLSFASITNYPWTQLCPRVGPILGNMN
jgi:hypothetical protein